MSYVAKNNKREFVPSTPPSPALTPSLLSERNKKNIFIFFGRSNQALQCNQEFSLSDCDVDNSLRHFIATSGVFFQAGGT